MLGHHLCSVPSHRCNGAYIVTKNLSHLQKHEAARSKLASLPDSVRCLLKNGLRDNAKDCNKDFGYYPYQINCEHKYHINFIPAHSVPVLLDTMGPSLTHENFLIELADGDDKGDDESAAHAFLKEYEHQCKKYGFVSAGSSQTKVWLEKVTNFPDEMCLNNIFLIMMMIALSTKASCSFHLIYSHRLFVLATHTLM